MADAQNSRLLRFALRVAGKPSADSRDVNARLDRALEVSQKDLEGSPVRDPVESVSTARSPSSARSTAFGIALRVNYARYAARR